MSYFWKQRGIGKPYGDSAFVFCQRTDFKWIVVLLKHPPVDLKCCKNTRW